MFLVFLVFVKNSVTGRVRTLRIGFEILIQRGELLLLFRRQPVRLRAEELPLQFGKLRFEFGKLVVVFLRQCLQFCQQQMQVRISGLLGRVCLKEFRYLGFQPFVCRTEFVVAHAWSSSRNLGWRG